MRKKVKHVMAGKQFRDHTCHWPGCKTQVPPAMWGCRVHWFRLPTKIRKIIWARYVPGQEERMDPSEKYLVAADKAQKFAEQWILEHPNEQG